MPKQEGNIFRVGNAIMSSNDIGYHDSSGGSPAAPQQQENSQNKGIWDKVQYSYIRTLYSSYKLTGITTNLSRYLFLIYHSNHV